MLKLRDGKEIGDYILRTFLPNPESRAMAKRTNVELTVRVTYIRTPDSEIRIARAISLLLATAHPDNDAEKSHT
jgi:hypothetical protein